VERVDLDYARREADSLQRFFEREGKQDLAEFAAMTRALVAELAVAREVVEAALLWRDGEDRDQDEIEDKLLKALRPFPRPDQHDPPATHDQAGIDQRLRDAGRALNEAVAERIEREGGS
jgi:hypothetical protein